MSATELTIQERRNAQLDVYRQLFGPMDQLEWSGYQRGPGSGPMFSGNDGEKYPACPICNGLQKPNGSFIPEAVGHRPGCKLALLLGKPTRPLKRGEQNVLAL
jgi:hypothetical protein